MSEKKSDVPLTFSGIPMFWKPRGDETPGNCHNPHLRMVSYPSGRAQGPPEGCRGYDPGHLMGEVNDLAKKTSKSWRTPKRRQSLPVSAPINQTSYSQYPLTHGHGLLPMSPQGSSGVCWADTFCSDENAWILSFTSSWVGLTTSDRYRGLTIRPVYCNPVSSVSLSSSSAKVYIGGTYQLTAAVNPSNASDKSVTWSSSDDSVATVSSEGLVTGIAAGTCTITVTTINGLSDECTVNVFVLPEGAVDLGLSVLWHQCNLGATKPNEYGKYFAWGDVIGQTWNNGWSSRGFSSSKIPSYELDENSNLEPKYDAAYVVLGGNWRMPTSAELQELIDNCTSKWTNIGGVKGIRYTSKKTGYTDRSIFLPAAGSGGGGMTNLGSTGWYWSKTFGYKYRDEQYRYHYYSNDLEFSENGVVLSFGEIFFGHTIRPVSEY